MAKPVPIPGPVRQPTSMLSKGVKIRPSTASGYLETHESFYPTQLLDNKSQLDVFDRPMTSIGHNYYSVESDYQPSAHVLPPLSHRCRSPRTEVKSIQQQRRPTIDRTENLSIIDEYFLKRIEFDKIGSLLQGKVEEFIDLSILQDIKNIFKKYNNGYLTLPDFKFEMQRLLGIPTSKLNQLNALFQKIDWNNNERINWDEFCTYMQLEFEEKENQYYKEKNIEFILPAKCQNTIHRDNIVRILSLTDGSFACASSDGMISFWNSQLELKKKNSIILPEQLTQKNKKQTWITYCLILNEYTKIVVTTGDREIEFFELSNFEPYCKISSLPSLTLNMDYYCSKANADECTFFWGDESGCVNILTTNNTGESLRTWKKKPKSEGISNISLEQVLAQQDIEYVRWKVHNDWVSQLKYDEHLRQVISCCNDEETALVIGSSSGSSYAEADVKEGHQSATKPKSTSSKFTVFSQLSQPKLRKATDQTVFSVHKGVKTFDICKQKNLLVTGGMDRFIRIWNPYVNSKPIGILQGHSAPIAYVCIAGEENRLFTVYQDKCIEVWDIFDQNRLLTVRPKGHKIRGDLQGYNYSPVSKSLMFATTDVVSVLNIKVKQNIQADIPLSHKEPVTCSIYNPTFKHVITASEASIIKIWEVESGKKFFEFVGYENTSVTCMAMDFSGRRLITGSRNGVIKMWNYNNGHCLRELRRKDVYDISGRQEVASIQYVEISKNKFVVGVGWDRRINLFPDDNEDVVHLVQNPIKPWQDDIARGHKEDILCVASCPPNHLATSSYDGSVLVWNIVSGHVYAKLMPTNPPEKYQDECLDGDLSVTKVVFMKSRVQQREAAVLIASGPRGCIHFWNIHNGGKLFSQFQCHPVRGHMLSAMTVDNGDSVLVTGDKFGFVCVWNIKDYAMRGPEDQCPELIHRWRAHTELISEISIIVLIQKRTFILTSSTDFTVRMWTPNGEYVGTFGQDTEWNLYEKDTYQHPQVPYDVLIDPKSLPKIEVEDTKDLENKEAKENEKKKAASDKTPISQTLASQKQQHLLIDDSIISEMIKSKHYEHGKGKRLRNERLRPKLIDRGGPSDFQTLRYFELNTPPSDVTLTSRLKNKKENAYAMYEVK